MMLSGCAGIAYRPAINDSGLPAVVPLSGVEARSYLGVDVSRSGGFYAGESNVMGRAIYAESRGGEIWRGSYGAFLYGGLYDVAAFDDSIPNGTQGYLGAGPFLDLNAGIPLGAFRVGAGAHGGFSIVELGGYTDFRESLGARSAKFMAPNAAAYLFVEYALTDLDRLGLQLVASMAGVASATVSFHSDTFGLWATGWNQLPDGVTMAIRPGMAAGISLRVH